jgi:MFS family permease
LSAARALPEDQSLKPKQGMFSSLANRDFRFLWIGNLGATFAMQMQMVARGWLIYDMTRSPMDLAWVMLSFSLPMILFSLFGGVAADRLTKKWVMAVTQTANCVSTFWLAAIVITGNVEFWHFIAFGVFNGSILSFSMPARQAVIPEIVGEAQLVNAIALNSATMNLSRVLGPGFAGAIIALVAGGDTTSHFGVGVVFMVNGILYLLSVLTLLALHHQGHSQMTHPAPIMRDIGDGFRYIWNQELLRGLIIMTFIPLLFGFPVQSLMPVFNTEVLLGGPTELGLLMSSMGAGAVGGSLLLARMSESPHKGLILFSSAFAWSVFLALFALTETFWTAMVTSALTGLVSSIFMSLHMSLVTLIIAPEMRGRVMSVMMMTFGLMPLGALPVAFFAETIGIAISLVGCAVGLGALTLLLMMTVPALLKIEVDGPIEVHRRRF